MSAERRPVLLCYDGSPSAKRAIAEAGRITGGGPALVASVWEPLENVALPVPGLAGAALGGLQRLNEESASVAEALALQGAEAAEAAGFDARPLPLRAEGRVWRTLLDAAEDHDAAAIVVGSRGRSALGSAVLGGVAYALVHHATQPVLVVRGEPAPD